MDDAEFIKEVNERIGFSIIDPDNSKKLSQEVMMKLRTLWKQRRNLKSEDLKSEIKKILNAQPIK